MNIILSISILIFVIISKAREPEKELLTQFHMDIAASIQAVTEEIVLKLTKSIAQETQIKAIVTNPW